MKFDLMFRDSWIYTALQEFIHDSYANDWMISAFFTGVVVAIPTSLVMMKLLNKATIHKQ